MGLAVGVALGVGLAVTLGLLVSPVWCAPAAEPSEPAQAQIEVPEGIAPMPAGSLGPLDWVRDRFDRLNRSLDQAQHVLMQLSAVLRFGWRLASAAGFGICVFLALCLLLAVGIAQLGIVSPPWPMLCATALIGWLWYAGARVVTQGQSSGLDTIAAGAAVVLGPYLVACVLRWLWRQRWRMRLRPGADPFALDNLSATLALVDEVSRAGHHALSLRGIDRAEAAAKAQPAQEVLRSRLRE